MKDFDIERAKRQRSEEDRTFKIKGEVFILKNGVRPEALTMFDDIGPDSPLTATMDAWDHLFCEMVEDVDGAHDRYAAIRQDGEDPLSIDDLSELVHWMMEEVGGRPTGSSSDSTDGREQTGTDSTAGSSSPGTRKASKV